MSVSLLTLILQAQKEAHQEAVRTALTRVRAALVTGNAAMAQTLIFLEMAPDNAGYQARFIRESVELNTAHDNELQAAIAHLQAQLTTPSRTVSASGGSIAAGGDVGQAVVGDGNEVRTGIQAGKIEAENVVHGVQAQGVDP
ncbi:MAG: hypothetical protein KDE34_28860, partial [Anaerolineales bacterium]|nr:hypothetical protein [Anaerolineales bacterium]